MVKTTILLGHDRCSDEQVHVSRSSFQGAQHDAQLLIEGIRWHPTPGVQQGDSMLKSCLQCLGLGQRQFGHHCDH